MPTYPDIATKTLKLEPINGIETDISKGGVLRAQDFVATQQFEIELEHPWILESDVSTLEAFYVNNKNTVITTQELSDGNTYDCLHVFYPRVEDLNGVYKRVRQRLIGTQN